ncbi:MAG: class GN sortase [Gammaproteobacteria bacterium]
MRGLTKLLLVAAITLTASQWSEAGMIRAKAWLAPILIERAWTDSQTHDVNVKPWPWADTWPVARLLVPRLDIEQFVLAGANGASLPFGPGHIAASSLPGAAGTIAVAGHRDTHFAFLDRLTAGDVVVLEGRDGRRHRYRVRERMIVDSRTNAMQLGDQAEHLLLVTCEPTSALSARGPWRLVVAAAGIGTTYD